MKRLTVTVRHGSIYNSVPLSVCLFVRFCRKHYGTERHQTLRDYEVGLQKCPPRVEIASFAVPEEISFNFQFSFVADGHFLNYRSLTSGYLAV